MGAYMTELVQMVGALVGIPFFVQIQQILQRGQFDLFTNAFKYYIDIQCVEKGHVY